MEKKKGILSGLRVIDFGQYLPGPLAAMLLADYGADVVHIDPPGGPVWNEYEANAVLMRGKRNIVLDLKKPADNAIAKKLIDTADIVIENFRPGVMDRLGLGKEECCKSNPMLIYCSIPGFAACDERAGIRGWDGIVSAEGGLYEASVLADDGRMRFITLPLASVFGAVIACHSIVSALIVREKCGRGQYIEAPLYDACFEIESTRGCWPRNIKRSKPSAEGRKHSDYEMLCLMRKYRCKDGRYVQVTPPPRGAKRMAEALFPEKWFCTEKFSDIQDEIDEYMTRLMLTKTAVEWEKCAQEEHLAGVVAANTSREWMHDDSAVSSRCVVDVKDPILGDTRQPGPVALMFGTGDCAGMARTLPDADRASILAELETLKKPQPPEHPGKPEPALKGMKVLDFCQVLAGPISGRLMAEYGAEVLKINNPRTFENPIAMVGHETVNNGKLTTFIDLKSEEGQWVLDNLIRESDIFHCNFSQSAYAHLNIKEEDIYRRNPNIILSQVNVHSIGGWRENERGHEDLGEAVSGISTRYSGTMKPETISILVCDNFTGHISVFSVLMAAYAKLKTGKPQKVQSCLSRSGTVAQLPYMLDYPGKVWDEPSGPSSKGWSFSNRMYDTTDGTIFAATSKPELFKDVEGLEGIDFGSQVCESELETRFAAGSSELWVSRLNKAGIEARKCRRFTFETMTEPYAKLRGLSRTDMHDGLGELRVSSCSPRLSLTPPIPGRAVPAAGADTEAFLESFRATHKR